MSRLANSGSGPRLTITTQPLWRMRVARSVTRYLAYGMAVAGLLACARFAIAPPQPKLPHAPRIELPDIGAQGYACLFARRYLSWDSSDPEAHQRGLASFVGAGVDADAGLTPSPIGAQQVQWAEVVQTRESAPGEHVYTVAVQTDVAGLQYLSVPVVRNAGGALALAGYPAFVGAPASGGAQDIAAGGREVDDPALATVVRRALRNYLAASGSELAADLTVAARVSLPGKPLALESAQWQRWTSDRRSVDALVEAQDAQGSRYTLLYELDVSRPDGRWEVSAIQMDPNA
jgi:Conjugative transposon protein TcpC